MNKEKAIQAVTGIYNALQIVPVSGEQNTAVMAGIFQALKEVGQWLNETEISESGESHDEGCS